MTGFDRIWCRILLLLIPIIALQNVILVCIAGTSQPSKDELELPPYRPKTSGKGLVLPPAPVSPDSLAGRPMFKLKGLFFDGNTLIPDEKLRKVAEPFLGKRVCLADLEEIRYRLTRMYVDMGYINSGAVLKHDQNVNDGIVAYQIMEGRLNRVVVTGCGRLKLEYVKERLHPDSELPFNVSELQKKFQLLLQDPLIEKMDGRIRPGLSRGEAILDLDVVRAKPYDLKLIADNHGSPGTGSFRGIAEGSLWNLTGGGDRLDLSMGLSQGSDQQNVGFSLPLGAGETRLNLNVSQNENAVIEAPLDKVDIESESYNFELNMTRRLLHSLNRNFEMGITLAARKSQTWLSGIPFSFSKGDMDGKARVTALRLTQSYVDRQPMTALALRSTMSIGLSLFDATVHDKDLPDGKFIAWLVQVQSAFRLGDLLGQVIMGGALQLANDSLLSLEQFSLGGADTLRGYRENERVRDNGYYLSLEWRFPLLEKTGEQRIEAAVFTDIGAAWNKGESHQRLHSAGLGLLWQWHERCNAQIYLAHDLEKADEKHEYDLQDSGIHFSVAIDLL